VTVSRDYLEAAGVRIPIVYDPDGPVLALDQPFEPLAWVVDQWARGHFVDLLDKVEGGESAAWNGFGAGRVRLEELMADDHPRTHEALAVWYELSGTRVIDDPVVVATIMSRRVFILPRAALIEILRALAALRVEAAKHPRPAPEPAAAPPPEEDVPTQLFCRTPTDGPPAHHERTLLVASEGLAAELDAAEAKAATEDERADVAVLRTVVLGELEGCGLFDEARVDDKRAYLDAWELPTLAGYLRAAEALRAYYAGSIRATYQLDPPAEQLLDGNVSLDWFRKPVATPEDATPEGWLAFCEGVLASNAPTGAAGVILSKLGGRWYEISWRVEARVWPVVLSARELVR
jgi:hypothetical protein